MLEDLLRTNDAARMAGVPVSTFADAAARGELPHYLIGGVKFFDPSDVETWAERRLVGRESDPAGNPCEVAA